MQLRFIARSVAAAVLGLVTVTPAAGKFKALATLLTEAGLVKTLQGAGPFTVFAPTDEAFAVIPAEAVAKLRADKAGLTKVLTFHVISGKILAADLAKMADKDGYITAKTVLGADVLASNGVIHVIDKVLMP